MKGASGMYEDARVVIHDEDIPEDEIFTLVSDKAECLNDFC